LKYDPYQAGSIAADKVAETVDDIINLLTDQAGLGGKGGVEVGASLAIDFSWLM